ncbi:unnamed protein product [Rotaria sp. Silwood1]|nr:unnamed protein product [Rotaria sp. Silwood1]CAF1411205.1 unnamed protein product [Rotaria sp. Silwood1]CAF3528794.1 unnamed protein product [Rotaria sp. Silwood1]CAF3586810.1 unnamed protein product [Rotaria sp. Silwood1]CAF4575253.1 unnamed protein product [Rotaria sp. Silwood1]
MDHCITTPSRSESQTTDDSRSLFIISGAAYQQARSLWRIECFNPFVPWLFSVRKSNVFNEKVPLITLDERA